jgi:Zn-dependent protease
LQLNPAEIAFQVLAFLFGLSIHEAAHAWTADRLGDDTARLLGRVTLNPVPHIDLFGTIIMPAIGLLSGLPVIGWAKPTPVNTLRLRHPRRDDILVTAAGPASNLLVCSVVLLLLLAIRAFSSEGAAVVGELARGGWSSASPDTSSAIAPVAMLLYWFLVINTLLCVFNLIPVPPLDGGMIVGQLLPASWQPMWDEVGKFSFLLLIALLYLNVPAYLFWPVFNVFRSALL